jgi:hypothetical protein
MKVTLTPALIANVSLMNQQNGKAARNLPETVLELFIHLRSADWQRKHKLQFLGQVIFHGLDSLTHWSAHKLDVN